MVNHETNELFFDNLEIPAENLIGEEGRGFRYILDGLNAERALIAAECIGDGYWFIDKVDGDTPSERVVFGRPIGKNQGVQFPIAEAYVDVEAANLMRFKACELFDAHEALRGGGEHGEATSPPRPHGKRRTPASSSTAASASPPSTTSSASSARRGSTRSRRSRPTSSWRTSRSTCSACRARSDGDPMHDGAANPVLARRAARNRHAGRFRGHSFTCDRRRSQAL